MKKPIYAIWALQAKAWKLFLNCLLQNILYYISVIAAKNYLVNFTIICTIQLYISVVQNFVICPVIIINFIVVATVKYNNVTINITNLQSSTPLGWSWDIDNLIETVCKMLKSKSPSCFGWRKILVHSVLKMLVKITHYHQTVSQSICDPIFHWLSSYESHERQPMGGQHSSSQ